MGKEFDGGLHIAQTEFMDGMEFDFCCVLYIRVLLMHLIIASLHLDSSARGSSFNWYISFKTLIFVFLLDC